MEPIFPFPNPKEINIHGHLPLLWMHDLVSSCPSLETFVNFGVVVKPKFIADNLIDLTSFMKLKKLRINFRSTSRGYGVDVPSEEKQRKNGLLYHVELSRLHVTHLQVGNFHPWIADIDIINGLLELTFPTSLSHVDLRGVTPTMKAFSFLHRHATQLRQVNVSFNMSRSCGLLHKVSRSLFVFDSIVQFIKTGQIIPSLTQFQDYPLPYPTAGPRSFSQSVGCASFGYSLAKISPRVVTGIAIGVAAVLPQYQHASLRDLLALIVDAITQFGTLEQLVVQASPDYGVQGSDNSLQSVLVSCSLFYIKSFADVLFYREYLPHFGVCTPWLLDGASLTSWCHVPILVGCLMGYHSFTILLRPSSTDRCRWKSFDGGL